MKQLEAFALANLIWEEPPAWLVSISVHPLSRAEQGGLAIIG